MGDNTPSRELKKAKDNKMKIVKLHWLVNLVQGKTGLNEFESIDIDKEIDMPKSIPKKSEQMTDLPKKETKKLSV